MDATNIIVYHGFFSFDLPSKSVPLVILLALNRFGGTKASRLQTDCDVWQKTDGHWQDILMVPTFTMSYYCCSLCLIFKANCNESNRKELSIGPGISYSFIILRITISIYF